MLKLGFMAEEYRYISSRNHMLLGVGEGEQIFNNIGKKGENLTIAVLSMNRSSLTIRLMQSIAACLPDFAGEFLIGDNNSEPLEKQLLYRTMADMPYRCRMLEFDRNYGVAGGRNRLFAEVKTDWIFSLDNDIYFVKNPLLKVQADIARLGCHFLSMPLLNEENRQVFIHGGHLYVDDIGTGISIGGSSAYIENEIDTDAEYPPFLCSFVPGGASILYRQTFLDCGGYDEGMFVGFEDSEFSIRLFQKGYKIGSCGIFCIIHDHPKPANAGDTAYEQKRFSNTKLLESARYFEQKHGLKIWNPMVEDWVNQRLREVLDEDIPAKSSKLGSLVKLPKVLLVVDVPGWALDNIARQVVKNCSDKFDIKILYLSDIDDSLVKVFIAGSDCQLIHFLWRPRLCELGSEWFNACLASLGLASQSFYQQYVSGKAICVSVYDHLFLDDDFEYSYKLFSDEKTLVDAYAVSSNILKQIYDMDRRIRMKPTMVLTDGVDLELFKPQRLERFAEAVKQRPLIIGWVGNSMWASEKEDFKGLHTLLKPVVKQLQDAGYPIELKSCDRQERFVPHREMPDYYADIDLYVCMSKIEGTPNPILEAMACGVPFISTNVGIVTEAAGELQSQFILQERSQECLKQALLRIIRQPEYLEQLSRENLLSIKAWDWQVKSRMFIDLWQLALKKA